MFGEYDDDDFSDYEDDDELDLDNEEDEENIAKMIDDLGY